MCGHDGRRAYIYHAAVAQSRRKQGIGKQLVDAAIDAAKKLNINKVVLVVFADNAQCNAFWSRIGFVLRNDLSYADLSVNEKTHIKGDSHESYGIIKINEDEEQDNEDPNLTGIGGWLIVLLLSIGLSILGMLIILFSSIGSGEISIIIISTYLLFAFLHAFMLTAMLKMLRYFPVMYVIVIIMFLALNVFIDIYTRSVGYMTIATFVLAAIWIPYLKKSERVRNTFDNKVVWGKN